MPSDSHGHAAGGDRRHRSATAGRRLRCRHDHRGDSGPIGRRTTRGDAGHAPRHRRSRGGD
ncbi:hypothetical protein DJ71_19375, partial [Halorubrum sp. E3]